MPPSLAANTIRARNANPAALVRRRAQPSNSARSASANTIRATYGDAASVDDAIAKGKITPARREHWLKLIGADPAVADVRAKTPNETAVPLTEIGHDVGQEDGSTGRDWFF